MSALSREPWPAVGVRSQPARPLNERELRLIEIERALKLDPDRDYRRQLRREFLDLTEPENAR